MVLFGATGFTGYLTAEHLLGRYGAEDSPRWALAGRDLAKLERVREKLAAEVSARGADLALLQADADDGASLTALARRTRVVCTTVGPYARFGSLLVAACAACGTDYCDLTGEVTWIARMIEAHTASARASGARIVHCCGFDCVPFDLGVYFVEQEMCVRAGAPSDRVSGRVRQLRGSVSGGTVASLLLMLEEAGRDVAARRILEDPEALVPAADRSRSEAADAWLPFHDPAFDEWVGPFVMSPINTKIVRRTHALLGQRYGREFRYDEGFLTGAGMLGAARASMLASGFSLAMSAGRIDLLRQAVAPWLPQPGDGPSQAERERGCFELVFHAEPAERSMAPLRACVRGDRDPGYGCTSRMLGECAVGLALDPPVCEGGSWTPASALGESLLRRLPAHAGLSFELEEV